VFIEAKDGGSGCAKLQSNHYNQQTNTKSFLQTRCPSCHPTNSVKALNGKKSHSMDLLTQSSPGGLPTLSLTINSSWLSWGRVAMPLINPLMPVPINKIHNYHRMENKVVNTVLKHFSNIRTEQSIFQNTPG